MRTSLLILAIFCSGCGKNEEPKVSVDPPEVGVERDQIVVDGDAFNNGRVNIEITGFDYEKLGEEIDKKVLLTRLQIDNLQENKKLDYRSWGLLPDGATRKTTLTCFKDEYGNKYEIIPAIKRYKFHEDQTIEADIMPGKSVTDILVFEKFVPNAKKATLTLQGNSLTDGKDLVFNLELPDAPPQDAAASTP